MSFRASIIASSFACAPQAANQIPQAIHTHPPPLELSPNLPHTQQAQHLRTLCTRLAPPACLPCSLHAFITQHTTWETQVIEVEYGTWPTLDIDDHRSIGRVSPPPRGVPELQELGGEECEEPGQRTE